MRKRFCDCCGGEVTDVYYDMMLMVKDPVEDDDQTASSQYSGDYCRECLESGRASTHAISALDPEENG